MKANKSSKAQQVVKAPTPKPRIIKQYNDMPSLSNTPDPIPEPSEAPPASKPPKAPTPKAKAPKPEANTGTPKATKKSVCIELVSRKGGATLDEMAQAIANQGICSHLKINRTTAGLWMRKIGFPVSFDKETKRYSKSV